MPLFVLDLLRRGVGIGRQNIGRQMPSATESILAKLGVLCQGRPLLAKNCNTLLLVSTSTLSWGLSCLESEPVLRLGLGKLVRGQGRRGTWPRYLVPLARDFVPSRIPVLVVFTPM